MGHLAMIRFGVLAIAIFLASCAGTIKHVPIERLVVFGDSNVDDGNRFRMFGSPVDFHFELKDFERLESDTVLLKYRRGPAQASL